MYTVIVADDEEEIRRSLIRKVDWESVGFQVVGEAENGAEALELAEQLEPDLLLTDVKMPFISGIELARQVREIRPTMQIAFLSGYDDFSYAQQAIQYNIISYMLKPISAEELTEELKKIHQKIDEKFRTFSSSNQEQEKTEQGEFLMPLLLDTFWDADAANLEKTLEEEALSFGVLKEDNLGLFHYVVLVTRIVDGEGTDHTTRASVHSVDSILEKYVKYSSVYIKGRVVSLLMATDAGFQKYLHILVEDITQSVSRILGLNCIIVVGRTAERLSDCHACYMEAMEALKHLEKNESSVYFISDERPRRSGEVLCDQALHIIEEQHGDQNLSLVSVSNAIAISPNYLSALIKKNTGSTFKDLLTKKRIESARAMLLRTSLKIREITEKCGYSDQHYFSYCFKKYTGMSPNQCRRTNEESEETREKK